MDKVGKKRAPSDALQSKIFTRWVHQKVHPTRGILVKDLAVDMQDGLLLIYLMEVLSEKPCTKKYNKTPKMKPHQIDNCNVALEFVWSCGVQMQLKPSAEQINAGDVKSILSLIYAIMLKYMKVGDEDEAMNARDALLMWSQQQCAPYELVVDNLTTAWEDGRALCALVHRHRPKLIGEFSDLKGKSAEANVTLAMDAAHKYFGLEKYMTPAEFLSLDEKCMVVYISEYFYGIAEQRKLDLAAKSLGKVIKFTEDNDAMKKEYETKVASFKNTLDKVKAILNDRTIDNTLEGAKAKIEEFYHYKTNEKGQLVTMQLSLESLYNHISMRLAQNSRPAYVPVGMTLADVDNEMKKLEEVERERQVALQKELSRQLRLLNLHTQHNKLVSRLNDYIELKKVYLKEREVIESVSAATLNIRRLDAYDKEFAATKQDLFENRIKTLGKELDNERFSKISLVTDAETDLNTRLTELASLSGMKRPVLLDHLAREEFKEKLLLQVKAHDEVAAGLKSWIEEKKVFLNQDEIVNCISDASAHLAVLAAFENEKERMISSSVVALKNLGVSIITAKYNTQYSTWIYPHNDDVASCETGIDDEMKVLDVLREKKHARLTEQLRNETIKEGLRVDFAYVAAEASRYSADIVDMLGSATTFGFSLQEVQAYGAVLDKEDEVCTTKCATLVKEAEHLDVKLKAANVVDNVYTTATVASISSDVAKIKTAVGERRTRYDNELARLQEDDRLCQLFAGLVEPLTKNIFANKEKVSLAQGSLEEQLGIVEQFQANKDSDLSSLAQIKELAARIKARNIESNPHTSFTVEDCIVQGEQYSEFLARKSKMLTESIENAKLRGITAEQFAEMEKLFTSFDKDKSGAIDKKELKACMYALGEEKTKADIENYLKQYGNGSTIDLAGFKNLMIPIFGVSLSKQDVINAFLVINHQSPKAKREDMEVVLAEHDFAYYYSSNKGDDYQAFTDDIFSR